VVEEQKVLELCNGNYSTTWKNDLGGEKCPATARWGSGGDEGRWDIILRPGRVPGGDGEVTGGGDSEVEIGP
jgi:hypothetical protein